MTVNADRVVFGSVGFMTMDHNGEQEQSGEEQVPHREEANDDHQGDDNDEVTHQEGANDDHQGDDNDGLNVSD